MKNFFSTSKNKIIIIGIVIIAIISGIFALNSSSIKEKSALKKIDKILEGENFVGYPTVEDNGVSEEHYIRSDKLEDTGAYKPNLVFCYKINENIKPKKLYDKYKDKIGLITREKDGSLKAVCLPIYDDVSNADKKGNSIVTKTVLDKGKTKQLKGVVSPQNEELIPIEYDSVIDYENDYAKVIQNNKVGIVKKGGEVVIPTEYESLGIMTDYGYITFKEGEKEGLLNDKNEILIKPKYDNIICLTKGKVSFSLNGTCGIYDINTKKEKFFKEYQDIVPFNDDFYIVRTYKHESSRDDKDKEIDYKTMKEGFMNSNFEVIIPPSYNFINKEKEGRIAFRKEYGGKWGYLDKNLKEVIAPIYDSARDFSEDRAITKLEGTVYVIDKSGKSLWNDEEVWKGHHSPHAELNIEDFKDGEAKFKIVWYDEDSDRYFRNKQKILFEGEVKKDGDWTMRKKGF